jgi:hypothetical protein
MLTRIVQPSCSFPRGETCSHNYHGIVHSQYGRSTLQREGKSFRNHLGILGFVQQSVTVSIVSH